MTKPLALVFYENMLIGNRVVNRLYELGYRTAVVEDLSRLDRQTACEKPLVVLAEIARQSESVWAAVRVLKARVETAHVPVLAFARAAGRKRDRQMRETAQAAGVDLLVNQAGLLTQLPELLDQLIQVE